MEPTALDQLTHQPHDAAIGIAVLVIAIILVLMEIFFTWSCYKTMKAVPKDEQLQPAWLCWLFLIPLAGTIFNWIMLPFAIPKSIQNAFGRKSAVKNKANGLFITGLIFCISKVLLIIPYLNLLSVIVYFISWITYWIKVKNIRKQII